MRTVNVAIALFAVVSLSAPVLADETVPAAAEAPAKPAKPKKTCRDADPSSTSRIGGGRVCHTQAEWDDIDAHGGLKRSSSQSVQSRSADNN